MIVRVIVLGHIYTVLIWGTMLQIMFSWRDIDPVYYLVTLLCSIAFFLQPNIFGIGLSILPMMYHKKHSFNVLFFRGDNKSLVILCDPCKVHVIQYFICNSRNIFKWGLHVVMLEIANFHSFTDFSSWKL